MPTTPDVGSPRSGPSLQRRVGRYTLLIVALAVLVTGLGGYLATRASTFTAVDALLRSAAERALVRLGPQPDQAAVERYVQTTADLGVVVTAVVGADGRRWDGPGAEVLPPSERDRAVAAGAAGPVERTATTSDGATYRVRVVPAGPEPGYAVLVARSMAVTQQILAALATALVCFGVLAVVAAGLVARRVARAGVAPVRGLTAEVEKRAASDDLSPVSVVSEDEIGRLAVAFNHVLDAVRVARTRQARFVADAGHELRTPLTSMRTNIELLAADAEHAMLSPGDRVTIMRDVRAQLVEFSDLVRDLIGLTREDRTAADFTEVDVAAVLEEVVDRVSMRTSGLGWSVDLQPTWMQGDADLLARGFANVLDNAVKFSPEGGTVTVTLSHGVVRVGDDGRGIRVEERPFVFDRFFRSETSRATPGTGLGLSITESVVRQHGGSVVVTDAPGGGALLVMAFPSALSRSRRDLERDAGTRPALPGAGG